MTDLKRSDGQIVAAGQNFEAVYSAQEILKNRRKVLERANEINASRDIISTDNRTALFQQYSSQIPSNDLGLPTFIYRPDLIPPDLSEYTGEQRTAVLQAASNGVSYDGGYPILENGALFWEKFPWEPADAYEMFQRYLDMPLLNAEVTSQFIPTGISSEDLSNRATIQVAVRDITSLAQLYQPSNSSPFAHKPQSEYIDALREYSIIYCWPVRAKAYDLFIAAAYRKWREQKAYSVEQSHYRISEKLLAKASNELLERFNDPEQLADIKAKELLDMITKMATLQRVSVGLTANGDRNAETDTPKNASLELTLRTIAKSAGEESRQIQDDDAIQSILDDPDALVKAQELIIRMNTPANRSK